MTLDPFPKREYALTNLEPVYGAKPYSFELEEEYMARTYEVLKAAGDKTGGYPAWPLIPHRFSEAAILSTQDSLVIPEQP